MKIFAVLATAAALLTSCSPEVGALGDVGVDGGTARCVRAETEGVMEPDRLVDIVGERTSYSSAEEAIVVRAFIACVG